MLAFILDRKSFRCHSLEKKPIQVHMNMNMTKQLIELLSGKFSCEFNFSCPWSDINCSIRSWRRSSNRYEMELGIYYLASWKLRKLLIDSHISQCQSFRVTLNVWKHLLLLWFHTVTVCRGFVLLRTPSKRNLFCGVSWTKSIDSRFPKLQWSVSSLHLMSALKGHWLKVN